MPAIEFTAAVKDCKADLKARGFSLTSTGGYRLGSLAVHARLRSPRWYPGDRPYDWTVEFGGPGAAWSRELDPVVFVYRQGDQQPEGDYYAVDTTGRVEHFVAEFRAKTLPTIDAATSPEALIELLLRRQIAPFGGFGKGNRRNQDQYATAILGIADANGLRERYVDAVTDLLRSELDESPQRRAAALRIAETEGLALT